MQNLKNEQPSFSKLSRFDLSLLSSIASSNTKSTLSNIGSRMQVPYNMILKHVDMLAEKGFVIIRIDSDASYEEDSIVFSLTTDGLEVVETMNFASNIGISRY